MGSAGPSLADGKEEVNVLVTGFGVRSPPVLSPKPFIDKKTFQPFGNNRINPSHLIASSLPSSFKTKELPTINIVKASPIPVIYRTVRELVPKLSFPNASSSSANAPSGAESGADHPALPFQDLLTADTSAKNKPRYDFVLHIGMAPPRKFFTMETRAHRDGYKARDEDGETMEVDHFWASKYDAPGVLKTGFDTTDVWRRWKSELMGEDVRPSDDAGHFLCDFIYYTSLVEFWRRAPEQPIPVMFLHVPGKVEDVEIETGRKVALGLIRAMVGSWRRNA